MGLSDAELAGTYAMTALSGLATSFAMLFVLRIMVGVGEAGCVPANHAIIGDRFTSERRAFAISVFQAGGLLGLTLGLFGAGLIAENFGWRIALGSVGIAGIPLAPITYFTLRDRAPRDADSSATVEPIGAALMPLLRRLALIYLVVGRSISEGTPYMNALPSGNRVMSFDSLSFDVTIDPTFDAAAVRAGRYCDVLTLSIMPAN